MIFELSIRRYKNRHCIICLKSEDENNYFTTKQTNTQEMDRAQMNGERRREN